MKISAAQLTCEGMGPAEAVDNEMLAPKCVQVPWDGTRKDLDW